MKEYPIEEIKGIVEESWSKMMTEIDDHINTDFLEIDIKLNYNFFGEGFELKFSNSRDD